MAALYRYLSVVLLAAFVSAQATTSSSTLIAATTNITNASSVISSASGVISSATANLSSATSAASSLSSAASSAASAAATATGAVSSSLSSVASSLSSAASSASSVASSASSRASSASSVISSITSQSTLATSSIAPTTASSTRVETSTSIPASTSTRTSSSVPPSSSSTVATSSSRAASSSSSSQTFTYSSVSSSIIYTSTAYSTSNVFVTTQPDGVTSRSTQYTVVATTVPATTIFSTTVITSTTSPTGVAGLQQDSSASGSGSGLSTGAKAGIGAGVGVAVLAAAIIGALYAMRRRKRHDRVADSDRYTPSLGPSMVGGAGFAGGAGFLHKENSHYTQSETHQDPLARYATPGVSSMTATQRASIPANSRTSDISSVSDNGQYNRPPPMAAVPERNYFRDPVNELPEDSHGGYVAGGAYRHHGGGDTPSLYSEEGDHGPPRGQAPSPLSASDNAGRLELPAEQAMSPVRESGYRGMDPEQPYHTRAQLTKPQGRFDPSHNF